MDNQQEVDKRFEDIMKPNVVNVKTHRPPAKFPELRYLWGITGIACVALLVISATVSTFLEAL
jgi:hypothetical protein